MTKHLSRLAALLILCLLGATSAHAQASPRPWRVCVGDSHIPPYIGVDEAHPGTVERLMSEAGRQVGLNVSLLRYPAARCRAMLESRTVDAIVAASTPSNLQAFQFPVNGNEVDVSRRLVRVNLVLVKRPDSPYEWDGKALSGGEPSTMLVGTLSGMFAAIDPLKKLGFQVDPSASTTPQLLLKLANRRIDLALAIEESGEDTLQDPRLNKLVILPKPFSSPVFFAAAPKNLPAETQAITEAWWQAIGRLRETPPYRDH